MKWYALVEIEFQPIVHEWLQRIKGYDKRQ